MARPNSGNNEQYDDYEEYHRPNKSERKNQQRRSRRDTKHYLKDWTYDDDSYEETETEEDE